MQTRDVAISRVRLMLSCPPSNIFGFPNIELDSMVYLRLCRVVVRLSRLSFKMSVDPKVDAWARQGHARVDLRETQEILK